MTSAQNYKSWLTVVNLNEKAYFLAHPVVDYVSAHRYV